MNLLSIVLFMSCLPSALIDFALPKWKADKSVRIEDAYKWTYQATLGGEHAVPNAESAGKWLAGEWESLSTQPRNEPVWEPLCPGGEIGRLNLRSFRASGGKPEDLLRAFLASSREYRSGPENFIAAWTEFGDRLKRKPAGKLTRDAWVELNAKMQARNYPAIHHSETYEKAAHPAYRILTSTEMKTLLLR